MNQSEKLSIIKNMILEEKKSLQKTQMFGLVMGIILLSIMLGYTVYIQFVFKKYMSTQDISSVVSYALSSQIPKVSQTLEESMKTEIPKVIQELKNHSIGEVKNLRENGNAYIKGGLEKIFIDLDHYFAEVLWAELSPFREQIAEQLEMFKTYENSVDTMKAFEEIIDQAIYSQLSNLLEDSSKMMRSIEIDAHKSLRNDLKNLTVKDRFFRYWAVLINQLTQS